MKYNDLDQERAERSSATCTIYRHHVVKSNTSGSAQAVAGLEQELERHSSSCSSLVSASLHRPLLILTESIQIPFAVTSILFLMLCSCQTLPASKQTARSAPVTISYDTDGSLPWPTTTSEAFYGDAEYDEAVVSPESCLGYPVGSRMATYDAIIGCFKTWAKTSERVRVENYGVSHEGRPLVRVIISSKKNMNRLDSILKDLGQLTQPQTASSVEVARVVRNSPAVGWFAYSIHGDETSGADASLVFGHYLVAGTDARANNIRKQTVVVIDPIVNPDGRARFLGMVQQSHSMVPNADYMSMHRGPWPLGRGNHYLFDLNRDWLTGSQPETRARWANFLRFHPQLYADIHEMGATDTYLFSPKGRPVNPNYGPKAKKWNQVFARHQSRAFDDYGWSYYTREWSDNWFPGYASTYSPLQGAVGILYEQARYAGQPTRRRSGEIATYREAIHRHAVSSLSNAVSLADNRRQILQDYLAFHQAGVSSSAPARSFVIMPGQNLSRERELVNLLMEQGIAVHRTSRPQVVRNAESMMGPTEKMVRIPAGSYIVHARQSRGALVHALLDFDPHFGRRDLEDERKLLMSRGYGNMYDVTTWNLGMAFGLQSYWIDTPSARGQRLSGLSPTPNNVKTPGDTPVAWVVDARDDAAMVFAAKAMQRGLAVYASDRDFDSMGVSFARGSFLVRVIENTSEKRTDISAVIQQAANEAGVKVHAALTGKSASAGPDLGGRHFHLLTSPKVGIFTNHPVSSADYGALWHWLDRRLGIPVTQMDMAAIGSYDLRRYNVLIVPPLRGQGRALTQLVPQLKTWVDAGGTLIAMESSAEKLADKRLGLTIVRRRRDVLSSLALYRGITERWFQSLTVQVSAQDIWERPSLPPPGPAEAALRPAVQARQGPDADDAREAEDAWLRRFSPGGTMLRAHADMTHWLTSGMGDELPILAQGDLAFMAPESVRVPVRLARADELRLSGLLWPEARKRLATTAWAIVERHGAGQIVLFAGRPGFRSQHLGTGRLLSNAVVLGPGMGAAQPAPW